MLDACKPKFNARTKKATCSMFDTRTEATLYGVITNRVDSRSPWRPVGVITYYCSWPCGC